MDLRTQPELIVDAACHTGEGPLWHPDEQAVFFVDIPAGRLYRHHPASGRTETFEIGQAVGGFTIQTDGALLLFMARGAVALWRNGHLTPLLPGIPGEEDSRFNDVIADPRGRVFCGTMSSPAHPGRLYRLDPDLRLTPMLEGIGTSNGMGFTPDGRGFYHTDTRTREICLFDYDEASGTLSNRRLFATAPAGEGGPDGLTVDAEGCVWSARWDGSRLVRYAPDGRLLATIPFPVLKVSCPTFGGPDYTDLFVTTAGGQDRARNGATAGSLYRLRCGARGVPEFRSRIVPPAP
jgi:D-xylonolactonase